MEFSHLYRKQHPHNSILWLHAIDEAIFMSDYGLLARRSAADLGEKPEIQIVQAACEWLRDPNNGHWLLVIGNADDVDYLLRELEPGDTQTTRQR